MSTTSTTKKTVLITGASGLLGRAAFAAFTKAGYNVVGTAFSRTSPPFVKLDLNDAEAVADLFAASLPLAGVVNTAAERRPDVAAKDAAGTRALNSQAPVQLAKLCEQHNIPFIHLSTDYVFDGKKPPYKEEDEPNPLNFYGETKLEGERAVLDANKSTAIVLRLPVLYGNVEYPGESAINVLVEAVVKAYEQRLPASVKMDHVGIRYPTNVEDVARVLVDLVEKTPIPAGLLQFSSQERYTKYEVALMAARIIGYPDTSFIEADMSAETNPSSAVSRPKDTQLSVDKLQSLDISTKTVSFSDWWRNHLATNLSKYTV
ncbi:NAD(P)-binding protein [Ramicandelaber brevisporus]|nr:NAD(P)-binding protein [Ramicandelaber brevisporus]